MRSDQVILVDSNDVETGIMEKLEAHQKGLLHRAFSICVFNDHGEMLIHRRAASKYHSASLWTNTCCSHPVPGESLADAVGRRLREEMGFSCEVRPVFSFEYRAELDGGLVEHELDHVYLGVWNGVPMPDPDEVAEWKYVPLSQLLAGIRLNPEIYTIWFRLLLPRLAQEMKLMNRI
jgi:isopentenyl-diphosphate Delta-isomerase